MYFRKIIIEIFHKYKFLVFELDLQAPKLKLSLLYYVIFQNCCAQFSNAFSNKLLQFFIEEFILAKVSLLSGLLIFSIPINIFSTIF